MARRPTTRTVGVLLIFALVVSGFAFFLSSRGLQTHQSNQPAKVVPAASHSKSNTRTNPSTHLVPLASQTNWPEFGFDAGNSRYNPNETTLTTANVGTLTLAWTANASTYANVGSTCCGGSWAAPIVVNGAVYLGSEDHGFYAFDASTGALVWKFLTEQSLNSSAAVANGQVYVGAADNRIYAFNASSGALTWNTLFTASPLYSSPAVVSGVVYVGLGNQVYALNGSTGAVRGSALTGGAVGSPAVVGGVAFVTSSDSRVYAFNTATGAMLWNFVTGAQFNYNSSPVVVNGTVYAGSGDGKVYALNATTGTLQWSFDTGASILGSPAVANGTVYQATGTGKLYALSASTGAQLWSYDTGAQNMFSAPAVANGIVFLADGNGVLRALDASTGDQLWSYPLPSGPGFASAIESSPTVVNGMVYIGGPDENLYAFQLP